MVMPMADDPEKSMFPNSTFDYEGFVNSCEKGYGVQPRRHWITTQYGGHVTFCNSAIFLPYKTMTYRKRDRL